MMLKGRIVAKQHGVCLSMQTINRFSYIERYSKMFAVDLIELVAGSLKLFV